MQVSIIWILFKPRVHDRKENALTDLSPRVKVHVCSRVHVLSSVHVLAWPCLWVFPSLLFSVSVRLYSSIDDSPHTWAYMDDTEHLFFYFAVVCSCRLFINIIVIHSSQRLLRATFIKDSCDQRPKRRCLSVLIVMNPTGGAHNNVDRRLTSTCRQDYKASSILAWS